MSQTYYNTNHCPRQFQYRINNPALERVSDRSSIDASFDHNINNKHDQDTIKQLRNPNKNLVQSEECSYYTCFYLHANLPASNPCSSNLSLFHTPEGRDVGRWQTNCILCYRDRTSTSHTGMYFIPLHISQ